MVLQVAIEDDDWLYRRVPSYYVNPGRISSAAFKTKKKHPDNELSVDLAKMISPKESLRRAGVPHFWVIELRAAEPRRLGFTVRHDPVVGNDAHALIEGENSMEKCERLAEAARPCYPP